MTLSVGVFGILVVVLAVGGLMARTVEARELFRTAAFVLGFWTILLAIL